MANGWSTEELSAAVEAYVDMLEKERKGIPFIKTEYYAALAARFNRTDKAFEFRMQNISYVMTLLGRSWLKGARPAKNVGANVAAEIERLIAKVEGRQYAPAVAFEIEVRDYAQQPHSKRPNGNSSPSTTATVITQYQRDASVKAWVLRQAAGHCESCGKEAPFSGTDGLPFLEVHHVRQLADHGSDTITNAVALCPNCHREMHYGENAKGRVSLLYGRVSRLVPE